VLACATGLLLPGAALASPAPGTRIDNTAIASGFDAGGLPLTPASNTVRTIVQGAGEGVSLRPSRGGYAAPGEALTLAHWLVNTGGLPGEYRLDALNLAVDGFDATGLALTHDRDRDGVAGPGDTPVALGGVVNVAVGDSASVLLTLGAPSTALLGAAALVRLTATGMAQGTTASLTDTLRTPAPGTLPEITFFDAPDFARPTYVSPLSSPLYVQVLARACDLDPLAVEFLRVTLRSARTGDRETFDATETGAHSGTFRVKPLAPTAPGPGTSAAGDGVLGIDRGDEVTAEVASCGRSLTTATVWIDPASVVYESRSNLPVGTVRVRLVDVSGAGNGGVPGGPARVFATDGVSPHPADVITDAQGRYLFPLVPRSTYRVEVTPPEPWRFPSRMGAASLPAGHFTDPAGSYGGAFTPADSLAPLALDVPVDLTGAIALFVEHTVSRSEAEWGDQLEYVIRVANRSDSSLATVTLHESLPPGFAYERGSALGGALDASGHVAALQPPESEAGASGPALAFGIGPLGPQAGYELRLRVRVRAGATPGDARAVAQAVAALAASNTAIASVLVRGDVFADEGGILGSVRVLSAEGALTSGLAGVRVFLDDGTWALTDAQGRFSFTGLSARTHALKLDRTTLPPRSAPVALERRDAGTPGLRFVDLQRGEFVRADFAVTGDTTAMREAQDRRMAALPRDEASRSLRRAMLRPEQRSRTDDPRTLPAAGTFTGERDGFALALVPPSRTTSAVTAAATLEQLLPTLDPELGFVGLSDLDTVVTTQLAVRVKGRLGTRLLLRVNGERMAESRVGRRVTAATAGLEAWEYVGVALKPGINVLELAPPHAQGRVAVRVVAPASLGWIGLLGPRSAPADGRSPVLFTLAVADSSGVPVGARTLVTLESTLGRVTAEDLDPARPGVQVAVEGGSTQVALLPPASPGRATVTAASGPYRTATGVEFVPEMRPLLVVGSLEGVVTLQGVRHPANERAPRRGFELPIEQFFTESADGTQSAGARGALFVQGRVRDDMQLTLGYDSDRDAEQRQFRDMQPDRGYPVLGDASVRGYDAQSTGRLYAKLERRDASLLYGDLTTNGPTFSSAGNLTLANYARSLTGAAAAWGDEASGGRAFTSREQSNSVVDEMQGDGISGPYALTRTPIVENSERVEVLVRSRDQSAVVLSSEVRQRFTDYELDALTGELLFRSPIPSLDADLNPVSVRVSYEVDGEGEPAWVHGVQLHERVTQRLDLAGTYVDDHDPVQPFELRGASALVRLASNTTFATEWAMTRRLATATDAASDGDAGRFEIKHEGARTQGRLWGMSAADGFTNPGAGLAAGRTEAGGRFAARIAERTRLAAEVLYSSDAGGQTKRRGVLATVDRTLSNAWRGELGARVSGETRATGDEEPLLTSVRARLLGQWPKHPEWSGYSEYEQDLRDPDRRLFALGGEYRFNARGRAYLRHELASSLSGPWALSSGEQRLATVAGVDASIAHDAHVFSEYRLADAFAGRDAQAAVGLRNSWRLRNGMRVGGSFERVNPLKGPRADEGPSTAVAGSLDWTEDPRWKGSARMEVRSSNAADQVLQTMAGAVKLDSAWTALGRHQLSLGGSTALGGRETGEDLMFALAFRDPGGPPRATGRWDALGRWELHYDRFPGDGERNLRVANVVGLNGMGRFPSGWNANLAWAGKLTRDESHGDALAGAAQWLHGRMLVDFGSVWDAGFSGSVLTGRSLAERQFGLGAEFGRQLPAGTWLSLGYNHLGYRDDELTSEEWTRSGAYLRLRAKFDETLFQRPGRRP
jgi:uncharacterized repeat protein (TIGR01451 family)